MSKLLRRLRDRGGHIGTSRRREAGWMEIYQGLVDDNRFSNVSVNMCKEYLEEIYQEDEPRADDEAILREMQAQEQELEAVNRRLRQVMKKELFQEITEPNCTAWK
ncbi:hypothetical protein COOONC_24235 [Cooperia oncophora]